MKLLSHLPNLFKLSYQEWKEDHASRLAAALAYYTIFSLAPMLVIVIAVAGLIWQRDAVQASLMNQVAPAIGRTVRAHAQLQGGHCCYPVSVSSPPPDATSGAASVRSRPPAA